MLTARVATAVSDVETPLVLASLTKETVSARSKAFDLAWADKSENSANEVAVSANTFRAFLPPASVTFCKETPCLRKLTTGFPSSASGAVTAFCEADPVTDASAALSPPPD